MQIFELVGSIFLDSKEATEGLDNIDDKGKKTESRFGKVAKGIAKGGAIVGGALTAAGAAGIAMANKFAGTADELDKTSMKMGINTDALQELRFAMGQVGVDHGTLNQALQRTNQRLGEAAAGNEKYQDALVELGFSLDDVKNGSLDVDDVFMQSIDTLNKMENSQQAAALAAELFGTKTAQELMPAIEAGTLTIEALRDEAHDLGAVISEDGIQAGVLWSDTLDKLRHMMGGVFNTLAQELLPVFQTFLDWIIAHMPQIQATVQVVFDVIRKVIGTAIEWIGKLISWLKDWYDNNQDIIEGIKQGFMDFVKVVVDLVSGFIDLLVWLWDKFGDDVLHILSYLWEQVQTIFQGAFNLLMNIFKVFSALFRGDWKGLWENLKTLVTDLLGTITQLIQNGFNFILSFGSKIFGKLRDNVLGVWDGIFTGIKSFINKIISAMNGMIGGMNKLGFDIPSWVPGLGGKSFSLNIPKIPSLDVGTNYVKEDGLAMIHEGEAVVPKKYNPAAGGESQHVNNYQGLFEGAIFQVRSDDDIKEIARELQEYFERTARRGGTVT